MTIMVLIKEKIPNNSTTSLFKHRVQNVLEKKFILSNNITLSWIYKFFFLDKTQLYFGSVIIYYSC